MADSNAAKALQEFGLKIGIPEMGFDEDGRCTLTFDEVITHLKLSETGDSLHYYLWIADIAEDQRSEVALAISDANYLLITPLGASLGMNRDTGDLVLCGEIQDRTLTLETLEQVFEQLVTFAQTWQSKIESCFSTKDETHTTPFRDNDFPARA